MAISGASSASSIPSHRSARCAHSWQPMESEIRLLTSRLAARIPLMQGHITMVMKQVSRPGPGMERGAAFQNRASTGRPWNTISRISGPPARRATIFRFTGGSIFEPLPSRRLKRRCRSFQAILIRMNSPRR
jgi:hypothetical protein